MSYARLGDLQLDNLETDQSLKSFQDALEIFGAGQDGAEESEDTLARLYFRVAGALRELGSQSEALLSLRKSVAVFERVAQQSRSTQAKRSLLMGYNQIVGLLAGTEILNVGDSNEAQAYARMNPVLDEPVIIKPNPDNDPNGDIVFGALDRPHDKNIVVFDPTGLVA